MQYSKSKRTQAEALIQELISIGARVETEPYFDPNATSGFLSDCRDRVSAIGQKLYVIGSNTTDFMYQAHSRVGVSLGRVAALELDACWDGIGTGQPGITAWAW